MSKNKTNEKPYPEGTIKCALEKIENGELSLRAWSQMVPRFMSQWFSELSERTATNIASLRATSCTPEIIAR